MLQNPCPLHIWDDLYDSFASVVKNIVLNFTRYFNFNGKKTSKKWFNDEILNLVKTKEKLYKKHKKYPFDIIYEQNYKAIQKKLKEKIS